LRRRASSDPSKHVVVDVNVDGDGDGDVLDKPWFSSTSPSPATTTFTSTSTIGALAVRAYGAIIAAWMTLAARALLSLVCAGCVLGSAVARAQEPREASAGETALAREHFERGVRAIRAEHWEDARVAFARAYQLSARPHILFNLAVAQAHTGHLVEAAESYRTFLSRAADRRSEGQREDARRALSQLERRIGRARLAIGGLEASDRVELDGAVVSRASLGEAMPVDPGAHTVRVLRDERVLTEQRFSLGDGATRTVTLRVRTTDAEPREVGPRADVPPPSETAARAPSDRAEPEPLTGGSPVTDDDDDEGGSILESPWLWLTVGVVAAGAVAAVIIVSSESSQPPPYSADLGVYPVR